MKDNALLTYMNYACHYKTRRLYSCITHLPPQSSITSSFFIHSILKRKQTQTFFFFILNLGWSIRICFRMSIFYIKNDVFNNKMHVGDGSSNIEWDFEETTIKVLCQRVLTQFWKSANKPSTIWTRHFNSLIWSTNNRQTTQNDRQTDRQQVVYEKYHLRDFHCECATVNWWFTFLANELFNTSFRWINFG